MQSRGDANDRANAELIVQADGIFITGGDQRRLLAMIGGTAADFAIKTALFANGACVAGTSAGASALSAHMLSHGKVEFQPEKGAVSLGAGLGLLNGIVIDQHFSQRHRLARLLSVVAQNPYLHGVGIDENTALIVELGHGIEVIGEGMVTMVDARDAISNVADVRDRCSPELLGVHLHLLPAGSTYQVDEAPAPLRSFMHIIAEQGGRRATARAPSSAISRHPGPP
jgi:cyanophycinase